ncbi:hypothetical protein D1814_12195 [Alteromonas sp. BL110]|uniref:DUF7010 family protein n=1 Tax=Alteromonas sp. BL110 TaxID=1714845 RepID=UPI000E51F2E7|nr:hypothetical protein [Alteromonas sp. BL110]AXT39382.1 hypothetical protein D1814_12195 [Alteromonas sp. BL110]RKM82132.1 hypothetical protein D7031_07355 [Alteromonas sp. BL110]
MEHTLDHISTASIQSSPVSLEQQREDFKRKRFIAMPLAGVFVWALLGMSALFVSELIITWMLYIGTGAIFYLGAGLSYLTGERFFAKNAVKNSFDRLFFVGMFMSLLVFAIALPVAAIDHTTVPLSIGILAGLMWMPLSWAIEHWVGYFHTIARTFGIVVAWYLFPEARVEAISAVIVAVYIVSLITLERRYQTIKSH